MEAPTDLPQQSLAAPRRPSRTVRALTSWAYLLLAVGFVRVLATVGGWLPTTALADGYAGPGNVAAVGACLAGFGLVLAAALWRRTSWLRRSALLVLLAMHLAFVVVFPPRWLVGWFQTEDALFYVVTDRPVFALTIDDGLDPDATPRLLETLRRHDARATFFVLGETLREYPDLARRCLDEGHEFANHQMTDTPAITLGDDALERSMRSADGLLSTITSPRWFRPGGGFVTPHAEAVCAALGYRLALASVFPFDSHIASTRFIAAYLEGRTGPGDVVVVHDRGERGLRAAAALDQALPRLAERGLRAVTLTELVGSD